MKFSVTEEADKFVIRDEDGNAYGSYDTKKEAQENAILWADYYEAPMVFQAL
jgi:hypothetical protein